MKTYTEYLFVPKKRLGSLIGPRGVFRHNIEKVTSTKLEIFKDGRVNITRSDKTDPVLAIKACEIVNAIALGFKSDIAVLLLKPDYSLIVISLKRETHGTKERIRQKARVIGKEGKAKKKIESITGVHVAIDGNDVGLLGPALDVKRAEEGVMGLVQGSPHGRVYKRIKESE